MREHDDLLAVSTYAGGDLLLVQGGGGNTSVKSDDGRRMWIKASGWRLGQMGPGRGYLETDVAALLALLDDPALAALPRQAAHEAAVAGTQAAVLGATGLRPSLETTFHAVLGRVVVHTHPVYVNAFTCLAGGAEALADALDEPLPWVPYATPGFALGRAVRDAARTWQTARGTAPASLVLGNHGLITAAEGAAEAMALTEQWVAVGRRCFGPLPGDVLAGVAQPAGLAAWASDLHTALARRYSLPARGLYVRPARRAALLTAAAQPEQYLLGGPLVPDDVVYGGHRVYAAEPARSPAAWLEEAPQAWPQTGRLIVALRGLGVVLAGPSAAFLDAMEENLLAHVLVRMLIARRGEAQTLPDAEVQYLLGMESERYRQSVAARGA